MFLASSARNTIVVVRFVFLNSSPKPIPNDVAGKNNISTYGYLAVSFLSAASVEHDTMFAR